MHIKRVRLENFKRHHEEEWIFYPGTNAICGPNGAGKTSVVEAIGLALFNHQPYRSRSELIRKGAKRTVVQVVIEAADGRDYRVERKITHTSAQFIVRDEETQQVLAEKIEPCLELLSELMEVEPETKLPQLFETILGVSQGTLTAAFLEGTRKRKDTFYPLLRVEEYEKVSKSMRPTLLNPVEKNILVLEDRVRNYDVLLSLLPEKKSECERASMSFRKGKEEIDVLEKQIPELVAEQVKLEQLQKQIREDEKKRSSLQAQSDGLSREKSSLRKDFQESGKAKEIVESEKGAHQKHQDLLGQQKQLFLREKESKELQKKTHKLEMEKNSLQKDVERGQKDLRELESLQAQLSALRPLIEEQEKLEQELKFIQQQSVSFEEIQKQKKDLEDAIVALKERAEKSSVECSELSSLQSSIQKVEEIKDEGTELKEKILEAEHIQKRRDDRLLEQKRTEEHLLQIFDEIDKQGVKLKELTLQEKEHDSSFHSAEESLERLRINLKSLEAQVERENNFQEQVSGGVCPYFQAQCNNLSDGQSLDLYLSNRLEEAIPRLNEAQKRLPILHKRTLSLKKESDAFAKQKNQLEVQIEERQRLRKDKEEQLVHVKEVLTTLVDQREQIATMSNRRHDLRELYREFDKDAKRAQRLPMVKEQLSSIEKDLQTQQKRLVVLEEEQAKRKESLGGLAVLERKKEKLGNPREKAAFFEKKCSGIAVAQEKYEAFQKKLASVQGDCLKAQELLHSFEGIEEERASIDDALQKTREAYTRFLQYEQSAKKFDTLKQKLVDVEQSFEKNLLEIKQLEEAGKPRLEAFDQEELNQLSQEIEQKKGRKLQLEVILPIQKTNAERLKEELGLLHEEKKRLEEDAQKLKGLKEVLECSKFIREVYQNAGPRITAALISSISRDADRLFRHLMDRNKLRLHWTEDFEVIIEEDGHERSFAGLSGGEQMSAALAIRLALVRELSSIRIAFFDEPTAHMDSIRRKNLAQQLIEIDGFDQLFVISHDDAFETITDHTVWIGIDEM